MDNFSELIKEAIAGGDSLESAMRKAANLAAKEAVESRFSYSATPQSQHALRLNLYAPL